MNDISHTIILDHQSLWNEKFNKEREILKNIFGKDALAIEHIGSTAVEGLKSKPIVDVAVLIENSEQADKFIEPLSGLGYVYDKANSSNERHFFRKGNPTEFHLSIAYENRGGFWQRQILFRDYLINHTEAREEYSKLKENLLTQDPTGSNGYIAGKTEFIQKVLDLAKSCQ